jgi:hypothetical protein
LLDVFREDADETDAHIFEYALAALVIRLRQVVIRSLDFDGKGVFLAVEVQHVVARWLLAAELKAIEAAVSEGGPEEALRVGR